MSKRKRIILIIAFIITPVFLLLIILNLDFNEIKHVINTLSIKAIFLAFIFHFTAYIFRTNVLYILLRQYRVSYSYLFANHAIQNFYVHIIPASLGELSFPFLLRKEIKPENSLAALITLKTTILLLTVILWVISLFIIFKTKYNHQIYILLKNIGIAAIIMLSLFLLLKKYHKLVLRIGVINMLFLKYKSNIIEFFNSLKNNYNRFKLFALFTNSLLSIISLTIFYSILLNEIGIPLSFFQIVFISTIGIAFTLLPIKSFGGFGTTEGTWVIGMSLLGYSSTTGLNSGLLIHTLALLNVLIIFSLGVILKKINETKSASQV